MAIEMDTDVISLICDKAHGMNRQIQNKVIASVTIDDLRNPENKYTHKKGFESVKDYSDLIESHYWYVKDLPDMFSFNLYTRDEGKKNTYYIIIDVDTSRLTDEIIDKYKTQLSKMCSEHHTYLKVIADNDFSVGNEILHRKETIKGNVSDIIAHVMDNAPYIDKDMIKQPDFMSLELFSYQKKTIQWLLNKEKEYPQLNYFIEKPIILGKFMFDPYDKEIKPSDSLNTLQFRGGGLVDDVGLGKTVQIITTALINRLDDIKYIQKGSDYFHSKATVVLCPNHLCGQWEREIIGYLKKDHKFKILKLRTKRDFDKYSYLDFLSADIIIISFTFLGNKVFTDKWGKGLPTTTYFKSTDFDTNIAKEHMDSYREGLMKNPFATLNDKGPILMAIKWHRLIVDEFHEVYANDDYTYIRNILPLIDARYKWSVTATPFANNDNLFNVLNFVTHYQVNKKDILNSPDVIDYLCTKCFRRNTKANVKNEYKLPPMDEEIIWLKFTQTERMMYNAYLANHANNKYDVYLRQLCCHPGIAQETKDKLSNCKSLKDIERIMVSHYKGEVEAQEEVLRKQRKRIKKSNKLIYKAIEAHKKKEEIAIDAESDDEDDDGIDDDIDPYIIDDSIKPETREQMQLAITEEFGTKETMLVKNLKERVKKQWEKYGVETNIYNGKNATYTFFNNVVNRIKDIADVDDSDEIVDDVDDEELDDDDFEEIEEEMCMICMNDILEDDISVTKCGHLFCFACIEAYISKTPRCPTCNKGMNAHDVFKVSYEKKKKPTTVEEKDKQALIDKVGTKLANMILFLKKKDKHTIIFSQWNDLLEKVGKALTENGVKNIFCKGNVFQKDKAMREFNTDDSIKVIMLSSESAASGANLTKAEQVILIDPVYGSYEYRKDIEHQATGRAHRLGQKNVLKVIRFIIRDTIEEEIQKANIVEDKKHVNAFKGEISEVKIED